MKTSVGAWWHKRRLGRQGEQAACALLRKKGMCIVATNWRCGRYEIDIVAQERDVFVFVEVKTRHAAGRTLPVDAITPAKRRALVQAVRLWCAEHKAWASPCRFDVIGVLVSETTLTVEHYPHAFDLSDVRGNSLDRGYSSWEPW